MSASISLVSSVMEFYKLEKVGLHCRFQNLEKEEYTCDAIGLSTTHILLEGGATIMPADGDEVIVYIEKLGRVCGIAKHVESGLRVVQFDLSQKQEERFQKKIDGIDKENEIPAEIEKPSKDNLLKRANGSIYDCKIRGVSLWGIFVETSANLELDEKIEIGNLVGFVKRKDDTGVRIAFKQGANQKAMPKGFQRL